MKGILDFFLISRFMWSPISKSLKLPVKYIGIFQKRSSKRTFHSYYKAIFGVNILIDVVQCTWELRETWEPEAVSTDGTWDTSGVVFLPHIYHKWLIVAARTLTFSLPLSEEQRPWETGLVISGWYWPHLRPLWQISLWWSMFRYKHCAKWEY